jgi:uncharacterized protein DUF2330
MKYKITLICVFLFATIPSIGFAVGKFYAESPAPKLPEELAIIIHDGREEILILQTSFDGQAQDFGWVIPLPEEPEVSNVAPGRAYHSLNELISYAHPKVITKTVGIGHITYIPPIILYISIALSVLFFAWFLIRIITNFSKEKHQRKPLWFLLPIALWLFFIATGKYEAWNPSPIMATSKVEPGILTVGIDKHVEDYVVKVLKSTRSDYLLNWLDEYDYKYSVNDEVLFKKYVDKGWCFVTVRISPSSLISHGGILKPLIFCFRSNRPIYPVQLTGSGGRSLKLALYVFSDHKVEIDDRFPIKFADHYTMPHWLKTHFMKTPPFWMEYRFEKIKFLTKFEGELSLDLMKNDLVFRNAPNNSSYRETKIETISGLQTLEELKFEMRMSFFFSRLIPLFIILAVAFIWEWKSRKRLMAKKVMSSQDPAGSSNEDSSKF